MSIATLLLTDTAKSGVPLDFMRPQASDSTPPPSVMNAVSGLIAAANSNNNYHVSTNPTPTMMNQTASNNANANLPPRHGSAAPTGTTTGSAFTVTNTRSLSPGRTSVVNARGGSPTNNINNRPASSSGVSATGVAEDDVPAYYESPVRFNSDVHRPDFISDEVLLATNEAAQLYGTLLELTRTNSVPDLATLEDACYKYYHQLKDVQILIEENATDIDCLEEIDQNVAEAMAECIYNIALCHVFTGSKNIGDTDNGAVASFTQAAATFDFLMTSELAHDTEKLELAEDNIRALSSICMATAHEISLQYYYSDTYHQVEENAALAHKASYYYTLAAAIVNNTYTIPNREMLLNFCNIKRLFTEGIMMFILGLEIGTTKGDSRRRKALEAFEEAQQHVLRVLPGDRMAAEMELTWFIKRCNKFKKIMKKGFLIEGAFTNKKRRTDQYTLSGAIPKENIVPQYPSEIKAIIEAEKKRLEDEEKGITALPFHNNADPSKPFASADNLDDCDRHSAADSDTEDFENVALNVNTYVNDEDIRLLPAPVAPSATHYHLVTTMITLDAPSLLPKDNKKKMIGDDDFALSVSRGSMTHRSSLATTVVSNTRSMAGRTTASTLAEQAQDKSQQPACSHCAALFYVDINYQDQAARSAVQTAISLAIRAGRLTEQDRIGIITFNKYGELPASTMPSADPAAALPCASNWLFSVVPATVDNVNKVTKEIMERKPQAKYEGWNGPSLVKAVLAGVKQLQCLEEVEGERNKYLNSKSTAEAIKSWVGNKNIFIVSDGGGNGINSDYDNWQLFNAKATRETLEKSGIQIHCFAAADAADHELLDGLSKVTRGNAGGTKAPFDSEKTVMQLTRWFVAGISSLKQRVASAIDVKLKCAQGILIANIVSDYCKPDPKTQYNLLKSECEIPVLPIAAENETHILVTFAVPATHSRRDIISLAEGSVNFFDAIRCKPDSRKLVIENVCSTRILSREIHFWATQLQVIGSRGACYLTTPSASRTLLRGGEIVMKHDVVTTSSTEKSNVILVSIEGTRFELSPNTTLSIVDIAVNKLLVRMSRGAMNVVSANECTVAVNVDDSYTVDVSPSSYASVSLDQRTGAFSANCVVGNAKITCIDSDEGGKRQSQRHSKHGNGIKAALQKKPEVVALPAPRQTSATVPDTPSIPWVIDEKTFFPWVDTANCDHSAATYKNRLKNKIRIETHVMRTKAAAAMKAVSNLMIRSMRFGTVANNGSFIVTICRQIAMYRLLNTVKYDITNSVAYSTSNKTLDKIRRMVDEFLVITSGRARPDRCWAEVYTTINASRAVAAERSIAGSTTIYETSDIRQQVKVQQSDKTRFAMLLAEQRERELEADRNQERERRETHLQPIYSLSDFGAINRSEIRNLLTILYDLPHIIDAVPALEDLLLTIGSDKALTEEQFCALFNHVTSHLQSQDFNTFSEILTKRVSELSKKIESTKITRSLFAIFIALDGEAKKGFVTMPQLVRLFQTTFGDNLQQFKRVESFTKAVIDARNALTAEAEGQHIITKRQATTSSLPSGAGSAPATPQPQPSASASAATAGAAKAVVNEDDGEVEFDKDGEQPFSSDAKVETSAAKVGASAAIEKDDDDKAFALAASEAEKNNQPPPPAPVEAAPIVVVEKGPHWDLATVEALDAVKVTLDVFITAMTGAFLKDVPEPTAHAQLATIKSQIYEKAKLPNSTEAILVKTKLDEELKHLIQWDLRHVFDGIDKKRDIPRVTAAGFKPQEGEHEQLFQLICAPICILANIDAPVIRRAGAGGAGASATTNAIAANPAATTTPSASNGGALVPSPPSPKNPSTPTRASATGAASSNLSSYHVDYFAGVQKCLRDDWQAFLKMLQTYPALSISHKQALRVSQHLTDRRLAPEVVFCKTPVISQLLTWLRLMLRIAYLSNKYDDCPPIADRLVSEAVAIQKKAEPLTTVSRIADDKKVVPQPSATQQSKAFQAAYKPVFGTKPGIQNEFGFGSVTKFAAEPPTRDGPPLGKPITIRAPNSSGGGGGCSAIIARMAEDVTALKKTGGILADSADDNGRPLTAPASRGGGNGQSHDSPLDADAAPTAAAAAGEQTTATTATSAGGDAGLRPQASSLLSAANANKSQLSFRNTEGGEQQRLHRKLSSTTTGHDASYLKTRGSQIHFGPSVAASSSALSATNAYASVGNLNANRAATMTAFVPSPPPARKPPTAATTGNISIEIPMVAEYGHNNASFPSSNAQNQNSKLNKSNDMIEATSVVDSNEDVHNTSEL